MAEIVIEFDRGEGWRVRFKGNSAASEDTLMAMLREYALHYPHRAFLDGVLVAEAYPPNQRLRRSSG